jgi:multiple sugar transport system permease protein
MLSRSLELIVRVSFSRARVVLTFLVCVVLAVVLTTPFAWLVRSSLMDAGQIFEFPPAWIPHPFVWSNYPDALTAVPFGKYLLNTLMILIPSVVGTVASTTLAAYAFSRLTWPGRDLIFGLLLLTFMLPFVATLIPAFLLWTSLHLVNTNWPLVLPHWFGSDVFFIFLLRQFFRVSWMKPRYSTAPIRCRFCGTSSFPSAARRSRPSPSCRAWRPGMTSSIRSST